ncbi:MAG: V-type ATP synthase subunit D [Desulfobacterota bacterium]|nr:V-type ATP synthase subunit D [Thermodesulfobacteriota bacterium]
MAITFQYNKTSLQQLERELKIRLQALPTLAAKETALRLEVHKAKQQVLMLEEQLRVKIDEAGKLARLWYEMPQDMVRVAEVVLRTEKIAGVAVSRVASVVYAVRPYSLFSMPAWIPEGIEIMKGLIELRIRLGLARRAVTILENARRKTTQKVNLYEKVQIPAYQDAMLKIKRFLEDEENLAKSSQKILKARLARGALAA